MGEAGKSKEQKKVPHSHGIKKNQHFHKCFILKEITSKEVKRNLLK